MTSTFRSLSTIAVIGVLATPGIAEAQLIPIKTTPIISGDSGMMLPSRTVGMGGVSVAVDDPLLDPFVNPAKGRRLRGLQVFIVPTLYTIDDGQGGGRTLSGGFTTGSSRFFAGGFFSYQNLVNTLPLIPWLIDLDPQVEDPLFPRDFNGQPVPGSYRRPRNLTWNAFWGFNLSQEGYSIGLSWSGSDTEQLEGYEYLYKDCLSLQHRGRSDLLRLGLFFEEEETGSAEFLLLLGRSNLTHYVTYPELELSWWMNPWRNWRWSMLSGSRSIGYDWWNVASNPGPIEVRRFEDQSRMVGFHLGAVRRLSDPTRRLGWNLTWNWKKYPSIPEYELEGMRAIPRDPGFVHAFSAGFGLSSTEPGIYGSWEVNLQPVFLETWGITDVPLQNWQGQEILPAGAKTIENSFRFLNGSFAFGGGWNGRDIGIQAGFRITSYNYSLRQKRNPSDIWEKRREDWLEFTPTWGGSLEFPDFQLQYSGYFRIGTGRPGVEQFWISPRNPMDSGGSLVLDPSDPLAAPTGKLVLEEHPVICHQISIVVPLKF